MITFKSIKLEYNKLTKSFWSGLKFLIYWLRAKEDREWRVCPGIVNAAWSVGAPKRTFYDHELDSDIQLKRCLRAWYIADIKWLFTTPAPVAIKLCPTNALNMLLHQRPINILCYRNQGVRNLQHEKFWTKRYPEPAWNKSK